ncbi:helix-turn-helix domain-containing protein [Halogeometricum borinquense]|uniref:Helix-turn-helix domain-containing protein n=1 Tax=Halogeometricum borinquense TaxID=60847 RepID=A0A6C0UDP5_9EURY|nr:helix-turn-helix domain-containing protein [Halogeometricum borinquense]QIB73267.1 helix-turn-helix domain-containing protein [Halogeometricum borinquense]QIQ77338.1 helix-turn-helix domain-containing protein [Halogeometricum borinquense]
MLSMTMDMVQYDCPYIAVTDDVDVSFHTMHWDFDPAREALETRILVTGESRGALTEGLSSLEEQPGMRGFDLLSRQGESAVIKSFIHETNAMRVIREHDGYITGPFQIRDGSELWNVGFDTSQDADEALSDLERENDYTVEARNSISLEDYLDVVQNIDVATDYLDTCRSLSRVEQETLSKAVKAGYFQTPRDASLTTLAEEFDVSKTSVSKNLRRGEKKVLGSVVETLETIDETALTTGREKPHEHTQHEREQRQRENQKRVNLQQS